MKSDEKKLEEMVERIKKMGENVKIEIIEEKPRPRRLLMARKLIRLLDVADFWEIFRNIPKLPEIQKKRNHLRDCLRYGLGYDDQKPEGYEKELWRLEAAVAKFKSDMKKGKAK